MADLKELAESRKAAFNFDPRKLEIKPGLNARNLDASEHRQGIRDLAAEIEIVGGIRTPLEIFAEGDHVYVAHGHRRHAAVMLLIAEHRLPLATIPCISEPRGRNETDRIVDQYLLNNSTMPLSRNEIAYNLKRLLNGGMTLADIAHRHAKSVSWVNNVLDYAEMPSEVHKAVEKGEISATLAHAITRGRGPLVAVAAVEDAVQTAKAKGKKRATPKDAVFHNVEQERAESDRVDTLLVDFLQGFLDEYPIDRGDLQKLVFSIRRGDVNHLYIR